jgi:hypothetical protein
MGSRLETRTVVWLLTIDSTVVNRLGDVKEAELQSRQQIGIQDQGIRLAVVAIRQDIELTFGLLFASNATGVAHTSREQPVLLQVVDPDHLAIWLSGYYSGKRDTTTVNVEQLKVTS